VQDDVVLLREFEAEGAVLDLNGQLQAQSPTFFVFFFPFPCFPSGTSFSFRSIKLTIRLRCSDHERALIRVVVTQLASTNVPARDQRKNPQTLRPRV
jgi:hypothetical protein